MAEDSPNRNTPHVSGPSRLALEHRRGVERLEIGAADALGVDRPRRDDPGLPRVPANRLGMRPSARACVATRIP
jgi:hypothetical protein